MNKACVQCGAPLKKGNIKVIRPRGKKRPFRVCRRCPVVKTWTAHFSAKEETVSAAFGSPFIIGGTAAKVFQRPQDTTGGPFPDEVVQDYSEPPKYRYFMTQDQANKFKASVERNVAFGFGIAFEVIPVPEDLVDQDPDKYADLVEVTVEWKNGN